MYIWKTESANPTDANRWVFYLPDDVGWMAEFWGAMSLLFFEKNYKVDGGVSALDATQVWIQAYLGARIMPEVGDVKFGTWSVMPDNMLACDGSTYNRVDYQKLYEVMDAEYIIDANQFRVPDLRGRSIIGAGQGAGLSNRVIGQSGGSETVQLTISEMPSHDHSTSQYSPNIDVEGAGVPDPSAVGLPKLPDSTGDRGGDQPHENMSPFTVLKAGIVYT